MYNVQAYVETTLKDIVSQTYENIEIIVVDDGSTDGSVKLIETYAKEDSRIKLISIKNQGPSKARNVGMEVASGKYIRFVDADDRIPSTSIERMVNAYAKDEEIDLVLGNYICVPEKNYFTGKNISEGKLTQKAFIVQFVKYMKAFYYGVVWNKLYKKEIIDQYDIKFIEGIDWCEDFFFNIDYYSTCRAFYAINEKEGVYEYHIRNSGITGTLEKWEKEKICNIDKLREEKIKQYCKKFGMEALYENDWKFSNLYDLLSATAKRKYHKSIFVRYREFRRLLRQEGAYLYVSTRQEKDDFAVWKNAMISIEKDRYIKLFLFFWIKGCIVTYLRPIEILLRKWVDALLPKSL